VRYDFVNPFVSSAREILEEVLSGRIDAGKIRLSPAPVSSLGVTAIVGVTGEGEGRVLFDMSRKTALAIASEMNEEPQTELSVLAQENALSRA
jgi:chemotaxis protein CheX